MLGILIRRLRPLVWPCVMLLLAATLGTCGGNGARSEPLQCVAGEKP